MRSLCLVALAAISMADAQVRFRGVSYTAWTKDSYGSAESDASLARMRPIGIDTVSINVWEFQKDIHSYEIGPLYDRYSASPKSVRHAIRMAKRLGLRVVLKPLIDVNGGSDQWRGEIVPSEKWFRAYHRFINRWADLARQESVDLFSIGCELERTEAWSASWRSVARDVRKHYKGPLTYSSNYNDETSLKWWDAVDYIGIDAYYPLTKSTNPTLAELKQAWEARADAIDQWRRAQWPSKKVIFTEAGYCSTDGSNKEPWSWAAHGLDLQEQADCYEALLSTMTQRSWWAGALWWNWDTNPNAGGPKDQGYTPQNKPVEQVLRRFYAVPR